MNDTPWPSHAECARTILARARLGTLSTLRGGAPFGSLVELALAEDGAPVLLLSDLAVHTQNLRADPRASLLVADVLRPTEPLADGRVTLVGAVTAAAAEEERAALLERYLARHPGAARYASFNDFRIYRMDVQEVRFVAGFGRMGWVEAAAWRSAAPDPLAESAPGICAHMNADHADALEVYCRAFGGLTDVAHAAMVWVDRLGFDVVATLADGRTERRRWGFDPEANTPEAVRRALVAMVRAGREQLAGAE